MERPGVQGVVLDAALLFTKADGVHGVEPHIQTLLYRLSYSNLKMGILFNDLNERFSPEKEILLKSMASGHVPHIKNSDTGCPGNTLKDFTSAWSVSAESCIFLTAPLQGPLKDELLNQGWYLCSVSGTTWSDRSGKERTIKHVQELFCLIASINKAVCHEVVIVGYTMKWSREIDFLKRGAIPLRSTDASLSFFPIIFDLPLLPQLAIVDMVLYKPTDEIMSVTLGESGNMDQIIFTAGMQQLTRYLYVHPHICVIDPMERILPLLDRASTHKILEGLSQLLVPNHSRIRSPRFVEVANFDNPGLLESLEAHNMSLPVIVKPRVACGVPNAHKMAVVFNHDGFINLAVPMPSTIQEYIDHGSRQYKFYVIGSKVFYSVRKSTPDAVMLAGAAGGSHIVFDSLKSLPVHFRDDGPRETSSYVSDDLDILDLELVHSAATWLRERLQLTIFGFDVVIQSVTHDHVVIDVNFFPTFKDVDEKSILAFWEALHRASTIHKEGRGVSL